MQAHEQGYQAGIAEGRQQGHEQGYQEGLAGAGTRSGRGEVSTSANSCPMQQLVSEFQTTLDALDSVIASRLMQMALEAARRDRSDANDGQLGTDQTDPTVVAAEPLFSGKPQLRGAPR